MLDDKRLTRCRLGVVLVLALAAAATLISPHPAQAQASGCRFVLGFAALHDRLPAVVGACLADEQHDPASGDSLQPTTNGLLVWRKADNFTAFTDGARTWIIGPFGLQQRLNGQRFSWEPNPQRLPIVPPPVAGERCHTAGLALELVDTDPGAGNVVATFRFTNLTGVLCTLYGFVGVQMLDAQNNALPTTVIRGGGWMSQEPGPALIRVPAGGGARFRMHWEQVPVGDEPACPVSARMAVIPPDEYTPVFVDVMARACGGGRLEVSAVQPA
jgi:hypothetical protein